ncbi:MAG TPA: ABC transporter ATP-binding protein, partial [Phycisphaerae bacterium]|nr:ABC transporter ATP-binding protein [Phycisphaerae bacterium]
MVPIRLDNLSKRFDTRRGTVRAVEEVRLTIEAGELFFLLGPSGCGKTTLLRMLAGFVEPSSGKVFFGDRDVTRVAPEHRDAAMVFQNYALWPHMTVAGNVAFGPSVRGMGRRQRRELVAELLETVRIADKASAKPMELSGGQQQRVALARALAVRPQCLLLDEPLSNLDAALRAAMRWEIRRVVKEAGTTAVYVTHDQAEALAIADRIAVMNEGRIVQVGTGQELYESPASRFVAQFLGEANFLEGVLVARVGQAAEVDTPLGAIRGRAPRELPETGPVVCCIRPECIRLGPGPQAEN